MGECNKCAKCCKELSFTVKQVMTDRLLREYYKAHGCKIIKDKIIVPMVCPHLKDNLCDIHDKKPFLCKSFKGQDTKFTTYKECGYNE